MPLPFRTVLVSTPAPALAADATAAPERVEDTMQEAHSATQPDSRLRGWINHHDERVPLALIDGALGEWLGRNENWALHLYARAMRDAERDAVCWTPLLDRLAVTGIWPTSKGRVVLGGKVSVVHPLPVAQVIEPLRRWLREQTDGAAFAPLAAFHATAVRALIQSRLAVLPAIASFTGEYPSPRTDAASAEQLVSPVGVERVPMPATEAQAPAAAPPSAQTHAAAPPSAQTHAAAPSSAQTHAAAPSIAPTHAAPPPIAQTHKAAPSIAQTLAAATPRPATPGMAQTLAQPVAAPAKPSIAQTLAAAPTKAATPSISQALAAPPTPPVTPSVTQILTAAPSRPATPSVVDTLMGPTRPLTAATPLMSGPVSSAPATRAPQAVSSATAASVPSSTVAEPAAATATPAATGAAPEFGPHGVVSQASTSWISSFLTPTSNAAVEERHYTPEQVGGLLSAATQATGRTDESQVRPEIRKAINTLIEYRALPSEKLYTLYSACRLVKTWVVRIVGHVAATIELWRAALRDNNWIEVREAIVRSASARRDSVIRLILSRCGSSDVLCALCLDGDMPDVPQIARRVRTANPRRLLEALLVAARTTGLRMTASDLSPLVHHDDPAVRQQAMALLHLMVRPA